MPYRPPMPMKWQTWWMPASFIQMKAFCCVAQGMDLWKRWRWYCFADPLDNQGAYQELPIVLRKRVWDVAAHSAEVDITIMGAPHPLHHLLAELCSCSPGKYRIQLANWIQCHLLHLKMVAKWCNACSQIMDDYLDHLLCDGPTDGLEVLLVSTALNVNINVVSDDVVWSSSHKGIDFSCLTVLLSTLGAYVCL